MRPHILLLLFWAVIAVQSRWIDRRYDDFRNERRRFDSLPRDEWFGENVESITGIDEPGNDASEPARDDLLRTLPANGELFEGDMVMNDQLRDIVLDRGEKRSSMVKDAGMWDFSIMTGTVELPYTTGENFTETHGDLFQKAIERYNEFTCMRLIPRTFQVDYLHFSSPNSSKGICSSTVGKAGGKQVVTLGKQCHVLGTILHEVMHNLGFIHEHTRPDRDQFVTVEWDNIKKDDRNNFETYPATTLRNDDVEYNFNSVMHYRNDAFTKKELLDDERDTLTSQKNKALQFGQRADFSKGDAQSVNEKYCMGTEANKVKYRTEALYNGLIENTSGNAPAFLTKKRKRLDSILKVLHEDEVAQSIIIADRADGVTKFAEVIKDLKADDHVHELLQQFKHKKEE